MLEELFKALLQKLMTGEVGMVELELGRLGEVGRYYMILSRRPASSLSKTGQSLRYCEFIGRVHIREAQRIGNPVGPLVHLGWAPPAQIRTGQQSSVPRLRATPGPSGPTLSGRLLWGTLLSRNPTRLEWPQIDHPRVLELFVSIESVK